ncbi:acyl-CoA N-acyltransferase [Durotheca rogersii]|uniref:acyl-CoA N-acyltransferase n=1 Tax=Durotheca rogersii TaxID=419775 RepID=UPI00221E7A0B|nr:acyl-CoA N-acyltransferase [Durotheca rogersii]KAI5860446.1 acyl-CoA N-acyltransferase [Durotheca rogersii]
MPLVVLPAQQSDIKVLHDIYFAAFKNEPVMGFLFPGGVDREAYDQVMKDSWGHDTNVYPIKCVDTDTGEIVGIANWEIFWRPGAENGWKMPEGMPWLTGKERERSESVIMPVWEIRDQLFSGRRHVYLQTTAVHPDHQRRGAGTLLLRWGMEVADKLELPLYLEATGTGLLLYEHEGFERLTHVRIIQKAEATGFETDIEVPLMVRLPSKAGGISFKEWADKGYPESY